MQPDLSGAQESEEQCAGFFEELLFMFLVFRSVRLPDSRAWEVLD